MRRSLMCPSWAIDVSWPVETMRFLSVTEPIVSGEKRWGKRGSEGIPPAPVDRVEGGEDAGLVALVPERGLLGKPGHGHARRSAIRPEPHARGFDVQRLRHRCFLPIRSI